MQYFNKKLLQKIFVKTIILVKRNIKIFIETKGGVKMTKDTITLEEMQDIIEFRDLVKPLPQQLKMDIAKGMAMFEAGYKSGFVDGIAEKEKTA